MTMTFDTFEISPVHEGDSWKLCDFVVSNADRLKRYFPITYRQNQTPNLSQLYVETAIKAFANKERFVFTIKESTTRQLCGIAIIKSLDWKKMQAEFAYVIDYRFKGQGLMSKVIRQLIDFALNTLKLKRLQIITHKDNLASVKVATRNAFVWQRTLKKSFTPPGESPLDMELYELYNA